MSATDREPEYHIELKSGKSIRLLAQGLPTDLDELAVAVAKQMDGWARAGNCIGLPAPGQYTEELVLVVIPWSSVDSVGIVVPD